jgi:hypothetical protein
MKQWIDEDPAPGKPKVFGEGSPERETLPWDAVEPVPLPKAPSDATVADTTASAVSEAAPETQQTPTAVTQLPPNGAVEGWVKAKATEVKGEDRARPLYHFEFWLEPPEEVKRRLVAVAYEFNTPAVRPQLQTSRERATGFRVSAGGLACADKVTITLKFNDGSSQQIDVDGCRLLS